MCSNDLSRYYGKVDVRTMLRFKSLSLFLLFAFLCGCAAPSTPSETSKPTETLAPLNPELTSPYVDLGYGDFGGGQIYGTTPNTEIIANNPGFKLPDNQLASKHNIYYRYDAPSVFRGIGLDQQYLIDVFNADNKGMSGRLSDGTSVNYVNGFWVIEKNGQKLFFNPDVPNLVTNPGGVFGYPLLVQDQAGNLFFGVTDQHGNLLTGTQFTPAFKSIAEIAAGLGYIGNSNLIGSFAYDRYGNITILDASGKTISIKPFLNPYAPIETATLAPKPAWQQTIESQDSQDKFFQIVDGKPVIDLYDTQSQESIVLNENSINITATTDVLSPNILTAKDADGKQYAFNPDFGWFQIPDVQMDYTKLEKYTPVTVDYFTDGRFALVSALKYAENPTISPDAPIPQFWVNCFHGEPSYGGYSNFVNIGMNPDGNFGLAQYKWPTLIKNYTSTNKSFAWAGNYKVYVNYGADYFYVIGRTIKTGEKQTQGFAYGLNSSNWERGKTSIESYIDSIDDGKIDLWMILAPPDDSNFSWNPNLVSFGFGPNPIVASLQQRGELISLFSPEDQQTILDVLNGIPVEYAPGATTPLWTAPLNKLPPGLSKFILLPGSG